MVLDEHVAAGRTPIAVDASGMDFLDSGGLRVLIDTDIRLCDGSDDGGSGLVLVDPSPQVVRLLRFAGLLDRFDPDD